MKDNKLLFIILILLYIFGCKDKISNSEDIDNPVGNIFLTADSVKTLTINDFHVNLNNRGELSYGSWNPGSYVSVIFRAGLWIGMEMNGESRGSIVCTKGMNPSNYTSQWEERKLGVFNLKDGTNYSLDNWPVNYGAPVNNLGLPDIYGDEMCWTCLQSDTTMTNISPFEKPINNLRVTQAVYGYAKDDLSNVIFIKYGITNLSSANWNNVYIGFFSDTDLYDALHNRTGYDLASSSTYTYDTLNNYVTGFTFLETPKDVGIGSHRIMRKNNYINPDFGEYSFNTPEQIIYTLKGLSNSGQPMINPATGEVTNFAFTGDPISRTGWLDTPVDVRSIISTKPFSLNPGETTWVTIAWIVTHGATLENSLTKFKTQMNKIKSDISLWQFN